jgi:hypothetical protein
MTGIKEQVQESISEIVFYPCNIVWDVSMEIDKKLIVLHDGTHPVTGTRMHIVEGVLPPTLLRNALVVGVETLRDLGIHSIRTDYVKFI